MLKTVEIVMHVRFYFVVGVLGRGPETDRERAHLCVKEKKL